MFMQSTQTEILEVFFYLLKVKFHSSDGRAHRRRDFKDLYIFLIRFINISSLLFQTSNQEVSNKDNTEQIPNAIKMTSDIPMETSNKTTQRRKQKRIKRE